MTRILFTRALIVLTLIASLAVLPATAQAAPRVDDGEDGGGFSLVRVVVDWVSERVRSVWGGGGADWDPTGGKKALLPPSPELPAPEKALDPQRSDG